jgi:molecular chaperone GrpE
MSQVTDQDTDPENENESLEPPNGDEKKIVEEDGGDESMISFDLGREASDEELELLDGAGGDRIDELEEELAEAKDQLLRAVAETENVRRRAQREKEDAGKYAITNFAREMLSVSDNIIRALDSERMEEERQANSELNAADLLERFNNFILGVTMIETEMQKTFERIGIEQIEPIGQTFDPKLHHALFEIEDLDKPAGTVMQVIEAGYVLRERLLREAKVGVSKGGPKITAEEVAQESDPSEAEGAAQAYEPSAETGSKVDKEL